MKIAGKRPVEWHKEVLELAQLLCETGEHSPLFGIPCFACIKEIQEMLEREHLERLSK